MQIYSGYEDVRQNIINAEESIRTGGNIYLNPKEAEADEILLRMKEKAVKKGILDSRNYAPSMHFFHAKPLIDEDPLFDVIKKVPKGAVIFVCKASQFSSINFMRGFAII